MKKYEAYLHRNGRIIIRQLPPGVESLFTTENKASPYLQKYLGVLEAENIVVARRKFEGVAQAELVS